MHIQMNADSIKQLAAELGADLVGIAPKSRWEALPAAQNPLTLMPDCQSVIVVGRKILRGAFRGVEEGTNFGSTYHAYGWAWHHGQFLLRTVHNLACEIEKNGFEAMPVLNLDPNAAVIPDYSELARLAGLGTPGRGGFFLTPRYGHRQRFGLVLTPLELPGDPVMELDFCRNCGACLKACPLHALKDTGRDLFELDHVLCANCKNGAGDAGNDRYAASCGRACMVALEGKVENQFHHRFRKRSVWERDLENRVTVRPLEQEEN